MRNLLLVLILFQISILSGFSQTKNIEISGVVSDEMGPLPGATVVVKGTTTNGAVTDANGFFKLKINQKDSILSFSFIGMKTKDIVLDGKTRVDVILESETKNIDEIVAVGYGYKKKKSLTGAIANIKSDEIQTTKALSLAQKLSGKVAGLNIRQGDGEPGTFNNKINIRGFGEPLFVIDGIVRGNSEDFQKLRSEDIESISVLKDASASIYGLNAANGVIIVTTKKGSLGKTKFTASAVTSFSSPTDMVEMANAGQYYQLRNEANVNVGIAPIISKEELQKWQEGAPGYESTNWADETFLDHSFRYDFNVSAQGGAKKTTYYINLGFVRDNGLLKTGDLNYKKYNFRANLTTQLTKTISASVNLSGIVDNRQTPIDGIFSIWRGTVSALPIHSVYANDNPEYLHRVQEGQAMNPVAISQSDLTGYGLIENYKYQSNFSLNYKAPFLKGLEFKAVASLDQNYYQSKSVRTDYSLYDYNEAEDIYAPTKFNDPSSIDNNYNNNSILTLQGYSIYKTTVNENHNIGATLVYEQKETKGRYAGIHKYYEFFTNAQIDQAGEKNAQSWGNEYNARNVSFLGRLNYDFKGKYLIEFAARYNGSYRYAPEVRWGFFPVLSGGWRVSDENFIKDNISWLSNLKIRGSYGIIGEDAGAAFQYIPGFSTTGGGAWAFKEGAYTMGAASPSLVNENLTWMTSNIKDIGFDLGLFDNKLTFTSDLYQKDREGIPAYRYVSIPNTFGGTLPQENLNSDRVKGLEFAFSHENKIGNFYYNISGNVNFSRSMNVYVESGPFTSSWEKYRAGRSNRWNDIIWMYNKIGQFQDEEDVLYSPVQDGKLGNLREMPGDFKYEDMNGDGVIDGNDIAPLTYNENPKTYYGLNLSCTWKGFELNMLFQGAANYTARYTHAYSTMFWDEGNLPAYFMDRWHLADIYEPENKEWVKGEWPAMRLVDDAGMLYAESDAWRRSATYLRFKNLQFGYTFKQGFLQKAGINSLRLYSNITNVFTWADRYIKPFDPEAISGAFSAGWKYPITRTVNLGLDINF